MQNVDPNLVRTKKGKKTKGKKGVKSVEETYQKKTQLEHILLRPDTYIGSVEPEQKQLWIFDEGSQKMVFKEITYVSGLYKIFDEILVNAADNKQRDNSMKFLKVEITRYAVSVFNDGEGIPVTIHKEHGVHVPELIFGHLLTSSNYNDGQKKTTGGRNGYGAKLTNIFSQKFVLETQDTSRGLKYKQTWTDNMSRCEKPRISNKTKGGDFTRVTFEPDFEKFGLAEFSGDMMALMKKRVFDIAGTSPRSMKVYLNGEHLRVKTFSDYAKMFVKEETPMVCERVNERWEVCVASSDGHFQQVSFVNSICTSKGGSHVKLVTDRICDRLLTEIKKKNKAMKNVRPFHIKNHLWLFVNALIENPAFDSQTKESLTSRRQSFGSTLELSEAFFKKVLKTGVIENVLSWAKFKEKRELKRTDGKKKARLTGLPKLEDANWAGGKNGNQCTLILTEGDSAKALAMSGLSVVGRDKYGVFPLKGKPLNVRDAPIAQIKKNAEFNAIKQIMGLKHGVKYTSTSQLRYGHLMIMADQDHDGSHIKGLVINMFAHFWPSLLELPGFLTEFVTPIVKCTKGKREMTFFTMPQYETWKEEHGDGKGWKIKYYKGLGTSTSKEAKHYFSNLSNHQVDFEFGGDEDMKAIEMAFSKKHCEQRKEWLGGFEPGTFLDMDVDTILYEEFINKELILFSVASNVRAIPSMMDGLKPGQRKILFSCFKRNLKKEIKVAQLAGYVSEHSAYHHGEASLTQTIVSLAHDFVGTNNINLLLPVGQFGTRHQGGKDAASARYIYTALNPVTRTLFHEDDMELLTYLKEDGQSIEPEFFMPVLPLVLVNGSSGIGTGYSSTVPNFDPRAVVENLRRLLACEELEPMHPWYKNHNGEVALKKPQAYVTYGRISEQEKGKYLISELPVGKWTLDYKTFLETLVQSGVLTDYKEYHTDTTVSFLIKVAPDKLDQIDTPDIYKTLKLQGSIATSNMVLFDSVGRLKKFESPEDILKDFFPLRLQFYERRKTFLMDKLSAELKKLSNRVRFILAVVNEELNIRNIPKAKLINTLVKQGYAAIPKRAMSKEEEDKDEEEEEGEEKVTAGDFDYLLSMPLWSLTLERVKALQHEEAEKLEKLAELEATSEKAFWLRDLDAFSAALDDQEALERKNEQGDGKRKKGRKVALRVQDIGEPIKPKALPAFKPKMVKKVEHVEEKQHKRENSEPVRQKKTATEKKTAPKRHTHAKTEAPKATAPKRRKLYSTAMSSLSALASSDSESGSDEDEGGPSLRQRLAARVAAKPSTVMSDSEESETEVDSESEWQASPEKPVKRTGARGRKLVSESESESEFERPVPKPKAEPKKRTAVAPKKKPVTKERKRPVPKPATKKRRLPAKPTPVEVVDSESEYEEPAEAKRAIAKPAARKRTLPSKPVVYFEDSQELEPPSPVEAADSSESEYCEEPTPVKRVQPKKRKLPSKPAPEPKAKPVKRRHIVESDSEEEGDWEEKQEEEAAVAVARPTRARRQVNYKEMDEGSSEEQSPSEEEESSGSEFEAGEESEWSE